MSFPTLVFLLGEIVILARAEQATVYAPSATVLTTSRLPIAMLRQRLCERSELCVHPLSLERQVQVDLRREECVSEWALEDLRAHGSDAPRA